MPIEWVAINKGAIMTKADMRALLLGIATDPSFPITKVEAHKAATYGDKYGNAKAPSTTIESTRLPRKGKKFYPWKQQGMKGA